MLEASLNKYISDMCNLIELNYKSSRLFKLTNYSSHDTEYVGKT